MIESVGWDGFAVAINNDDWTGASFKGPELLKVRAAKAPHIRQAKNAASHQDGGANRREEQKGQDLLEDGSFAREQRHQGGRRDEK